MEPQCPVTSLTHLGRVHWVRKTLALALLRDQLFIALCQPSRVPDCKGQAIMGEEGVHLPKGPTHRAPPGRRGQDSPCLPFCHSRSPLHLLRHQELSTLLPGSPSPGWAPQQRACPGAPRPPRSWGQPGVRRTAWRGPDQTSRAQVGASFFVSLET